MNNEEMNCLKSLSREELTYWYSKLDQGAKELLTKAFRDFHAIKITDVEVDHATAEDRFSASFAVNVHLCAQCKYAAQCDLPKEYCEPSRLYQKATNDESDYRDMYACLMFDYGC